MRTKYLGYWYWLFSMGFTTKTKQYIAPVFLLLIAVSATVVAAPATIPVNITIENKSGLGTIKGVVRDAGGSPIADATVAIFRSGTSKLLKQVNSSRDGSFLARILPGTYTVLAVAQGFNPVTLLGVEVPRASEVNYGFKLERSGSGNTLPEKLIDRNSSKWRIRGAQLQRSIYQNRDAKDPIVVADETTAAADEQSAEAPGKRRGQTVIETYFAGSRTGNSVGVNFATLLPVSRNVEIVFAGQVGKGKSTPQRFETALKFRPSD
ncbi:MAG: carboxypeptidase regulatory-like domain-containing protein, partial [Pyrinomonadaceae bacterium]